MRKLLAAITTLVIVILPACFKNKESKVESQDATLVQAAKPNPPSSNILQWQKCLGSSSNDFGYSVAKAADGSGYFVVGTTEGNNGNVTGNHGGRDVWVVKIDLTGTNILWQGAFGGTGNEEGTSVVATADGGCLIAGRTSSTDGDVSANHGGQDIWLVKLSNSGVVDWQQTKTFGGSGYDIANQIINTSDGGYAIVGQTTSNDGDLAGSGTTKARAWVIKLASNATVSWQKTLDVAGSKDDVGYGIAETSTGTFALTGRTLSVDNNANIWVASFDRDNNFWIKTLGGIGSGVGFEIVSSRNNGQDDGFAVVGYIGADASATKLDVNGNIVWQRTFRPSGSLARGRSIVSTANEYVIVGDNNGDMLIWRLGKDGSQLNGTTIGSAKNDVGEHLIATDDGMFLSVGSTSSSNGIVSGNHGLSDMWLVKFKF